MMIEIMAHVIFLVCLFCGVWNIIYFARKGNGSAIKYYILAKGLVILYLGIGYGLISLNHWAHLISYPGTDSYLMITILRVGAVSTALIFLADCFMRDKQ